MWNNTGLSDYCVYKWICIPMKWRVSCKTNHSIDNRVFVVPGSRVREQHSFWLTIDVFEIQYSRSIVATAPNLANLEAAKSVTRLAKEIRVITSWNEFGGPLALQELLAAVFQASGCYNKSKRISFSILAESPSSPRARGSYTAGHIDFGWPFPTISTCRCSLRTIGVK